MRLNTREACWRGFPGYPNPRAPATAWSGCREPAPWNEQRCGNRPRRLPARRAGLPRSAARRWADRRPGPGDSDPRAPHTQVVRGQMAVRTGNSVFSSASGAGRAVVATRDRIQHRHRNAHTPSELARGTSSCSCLEYTPPRDLAQSTKGDASQRISRSTYRSTSRCTSRRPHSRLPTSPLSSSSAPFTSAREERTDEWHSPVEHVDVL